VLGLLEVHGKPLEDVLLGAPPVQELASLSGTPLSKDLVGALGDSVIGFE
jgi:hypothetical protein